MRGYRSTARYQMIALSAVSDSTPAPHGARSFRKARVIRRHNVRVRLKRNQSSRP